MDSHDSGQADHGEGHGVHLPDPSIWPIVVGVASLIAGFALIWWSNDRQSAIAGPLLGVGVVAVLVSAAGWAFEDTIMRKKAELGHGPEPGPVRFTQVLTFAVAEGMATAARSTEGVITAIDRSDLRDLEGFQDLRITVSPDTGGPSTVLVETTWRGRDGINAYDATRQTLLDVVNEHGDQVVAGSVQVFDMEVLRDTKDTSFKFSMGAALTVIGGLAIAAFIFGAGLNLFAKESKAAAGGPSATPDANAAYTISARNVKFDKGALEAPPNAAVEFIFNNKDTTKHNLSFYRAKGGENLAQGEIIDGGKSEKVSFTTPTVGTYYFQCDVHEQMNGTFTVKDGAPPPGGAAPAATPSTSGTAAATVTR